MKMKKIKQKMKKMKIKKYHWAILLVISIFIAMYIYGMTKHYFPEPLHMGFGQYTDIATGIMIIGLLLSGVFLTRIFKKEKGTIGTGEYEKIKMTQKKKSKRGNK